MKIDFQFQTPYGVFSDALWFSDDEPLPSEEEIEAMKAERRDNWIASVQNLSLETTPVEETPVEETPVEEPPAQEE